MASIRFMNESGPFWDWLSNAAGDSAPDPFFPGQSRGYGYGYGGGAGGFGGFPGFGFGTWAGNPHHRRGHHHRGGPPPPPPPPPGHPGHHGHHHHGPPPPPPPPPPPADGEAPPNRNATVSDDTDGDTLSGDEHIATPSTSSAGGEPSDSKPQDKGKRPAWRGQGGRCPRGAFAGTGPGACGGRRGHPYGRPGGCHRRPSQQGARPANGPGPEDFLNGIFGLWNNLNSRESDNKQSQDFRPEADVFDTEDSYVVHLSLPGAKKEDIAVHWEADSSELKVSGVVYRPGDEDLIKTLALDERTVGVFDRAIRLGSRAYPAQIDADAISAKLEDGILRVTVPKLDKDYVEIKTVDIE